MPEFRPRLDNLPAQGRAFWRQPVVLLPAGLLLVLILARLIVGSDPQPTDLSLAREPSTVLDGASPSSWNDAVAAGAGAAGPAPQASAAPGRALIEAIELRPRLSDGRVTGYIVKPKGDAAMLTRAGLRPGDVLLGVDGRELDESRIGRLADEIGDLDDVEIVYERNGELRDRLLVFRQR